MNRARFRAAALGSLLLGALALPSTAAAQETLSFGSWQMFSWIIEQGDGTDPVDGAGFEFESLLETRIRLVDAGDAGDAFRLFVNGIEYGITPSVAWESVGAYTGDEAWIDERLGRLELLLAPGRYTLTLQVREDAGYGYGEGFIRADQIPATAVVPEPSTVLLTASGLAGMLAVARRRRRAAA